MERTEKAIIELAQALAGRRMFRKIALTDGSEIDGLPGRKTIFIIGAGASNAAAGLPLGRELATYLIEKLKCRSGENQIKFNELLNFMESNYGFDKDDFKTILFSLNQIDQEKLVDLVREALLNNFTSSYSYGFISNLLAEGFIDAIINFNFDEILDRHIESAFTDKRGYHYIYSDKTCSSESDLRFSTSSLNQLPIYIKPHGTISQRASLRFTRQDFYRIEPRQTELIENLLSHSPVNLIIVGFRLKFFEFSRLIEKSLLPGSQIFIIDKNEDILDPCLTKFYKKNLIKVTDESTLDNLMRLLSLALSGVLERQSPVPIYG